MVGVSIDQLSLINNVELYHQRWKLLKNVSAGVIARLRRSNLGYSEIRSLSFVFDGHRASACCASRPLGVTYQWSNFVFERNLRLSSARGNRSVLRVYDGAFPER